MFHKEGNKIIVITLVLVVAMFLLIDSFINISWLRILLMLTVLAFLIIILQFFRNPKRLTAANNKTVVSPVDGKVVVIEEVFEKEFFKENVYKLVYLCLQ